MKKIFWVAVREFMATAATKGFIIGMLIAPVMIAISIWGISLMIKHDKAPKITGEVAVVDKSFEVAESLETFLSPRAMAARRLKEKERFAKDAEELGGLVGALAGVAASSPQFDQALEQTMGEVPQLEIVSLPIDADVEAEKAPLLEGGIKDGGRLALVVIDENATRADALDEYGGYELYTRGKLDDRIQDEIRSGLRETILHHRFEHENFDRERYRKISAIATSRTTVTESGERKGGNELEMFLPAGFMVVLLIAVMTSGQYLLTNTVEEKSNRVVEVLLSAVSPMELMTGKIVGEMAVGFLILLLYGGMGIVGLIVFTLTDMLDVTTLIYFFIFFVIAYFVLASMMAAIGAAVNEMREAQTMMTPVMLIVMLPWILWLPITRNPDSILSVSLSFIPPINCFAMLLRMTSTSPPPHWQIWLSILLGVVSVWIALKLTAKIFRIGLLMYGKPPNFKTLIRWIRMA